jgi:penicillin-binding protein 2
VRLQPVQLRLVQLRLPCSFGKSDFSFEPGYAPHVAPHERFYMSSFAEDITAGDVTTGEDPVVRQAAIDALGNMNGTVVAIEPTSGRVLAMVNQKLALSSGAQPCSTIKLSVALAALSEGLVSKRDASFALGGN